VAIQIFEAAFARDPLHTALRGNVIASYFEQGQFDKALALFDSTNAENSADRHTLEMTAYLKWLQGDLAASLRFNEMAYESEPSNIVYKRNLGFDLLALFEPEQALEIDAPRVRMLALQRLGRAEEATILGFEQAAAGRLLPEFFQVLVENGEYAKLIEFVESRWPDLDDFESLYPERGGFGSPGMGFIAESYGKLGKEAQFNDAMARFKAALDQQVSQGANNPNVHFSQAVYAVLAGDNEKAITLLEDVFAHSGGFGINNLKAWPVFAPLNGDPRYEKAKAGLMEHINAERQKLGWEPVSI
jgi:tetratricopeptide (TPR) repeat protein